ncbi:MAG: peptidoglycan DD-metalloendopeptidase family protein [Bacteroidales bacterium]|nr:peptidoglycan DD-metalloendopeptidase family protein [Bacteroidales bacterium]
MKHQQRHTYRFNPHTLRYEKVFVSLRDRVKRISFNVLFGVVLGVVIVFVGLQFMESPKERSMKRELTKYKRQTRQLNDRVERAEKVLEDLEERDDALYRTIFEIDPVSQSERRSGIGGVERYADLEGLDDGGLLKETSKKVDDITKRLYVESKSLDEIYEMARNKSERMSSMPAIMPVAKQQAKVVSGFGMRFHPILKHYRLHAGMDITARQGTPVYATGDGVVRISGRNAQGLGGYGIVVVVDHGFGFQTLYAHMQGTKVRVGQKVKRGEQIGTVGSTGLSTGSHLHYEVILNGKKVDPVYYFSGDLTPEEYEEVIELARQVNQSMS